MKNRIIKFRAWDKKENKMLQNVSTGTIVIWGDDGYEALAKDCELMQFTGLKDKNGKEIYEGDILATENDGSDGADDWKKQILGSVFWNERYASFENLPDDDDNSIYSVKYVEVIGNIYENPELIK